MKKTTKIVSAAMAALMAASTLAVGSVSVSAASLKKPAKVKAVNVAKGIKITWKKVKGAKKYQVFRGKKKIKTVKKKTYTDKKAKSGKTYKYYVKAVKGKKKSKKSKAAKVVRLTKPAVSSVSNVSNGAFVSWKKVKGAKKYYVYSGSTKIAATTKLNCTYTKAVSGKTYSYKVKAVNGKSASVASAAKKGMFLSAPVVSVTVDKVTKTATVSWEKVTGAKSYKVVQSYPEEKTITASTTENTVTVNLGDNPTYYEFKVAAVNTSTSAYGAKGAAYIPEGCYYTDKETGNLSIKLVLKKGESYKEGTVFTDYFDAKKWPYDVKVADESVVKYEKGVLTAVAPGTTTATIAISDADSQKYIYDTICKAADMKFGNELKRGVIVLNITVTE